VPRSDDLDTLLRARPSPVVACDPIGTQAAARPRRRTFRVRCADGTLWKARRLGSPAAAARVEAIVGRLDPARFPRVVARRGAALLEEWVAGESLAAAAPEAAHLRWAGETLAAVHGAPPPPGARAARPRLGADLAWLVQAGALGAAEAEALRARAGAAPPAGRAILHRDLCPENVVADPAGRLVAVDNDAVRVGAPAEDLARTLYRWPMRPAEEALFLGAYEAAGGDAGPFRAARAWWTVAVLAHAARVRRARGYAGAGETLARLRAEAAR